MVKVAKVPLSALAEMDEKGLHQAGACGSWSLGGLVDGLGSLNPKP